MRTLLIGLLVCAPVAANAHDFWINNGGYQSLPGAPTGAVGIHCCSEHDCKSIRRTDVRIKPDGYHLPTGEVIPFSQAQPSEDSFYWTCRQPVTDLVRCFFAPMAGA